MQQLSLFENTVLEATERTGTTTQSYNYFAKKIGLSETQMNLLVNAGSGGMVSKWKRKIRFIQQTLKSKGLIAKGKQLGQWTTTPQGKRLLTKAPVMTAKAYFVTKSGIAFWGDANTLPMLFENEVDLIICSPPYLLTKDRPYGNIGADVTSYVNQLLKFAEGWMSMLSPTGSIVLNIGPSYLKGLGYQSLHNERMLVSFEDELGLHLVQKFSWWSPNKMPTGHWVTNKKKHCVNALEEFFWLSPNPKQAKANNQMVLTQYSSKFKKMIKDAMVRKPGVSYRPSGQRVDDATFYADNGGAIAHNLLIDTPEGANSAYSVFCKEKGLPRHPAMFPLRIPSFFINYLTEVDDLVIDPFLGSCVAAAAAEKLSRRWAGTEVIKEYLDGGRCRFESLLQA